MIVHIEATRNLPSGIGGTTRFVASRGEYRYLRISLSVWLPPADRVAIAGHELQHAVEVAHSLAANAAEVRRWFETSGFRVRVSHDLFETNAALQIEMKIRQELRARPALTTRSCPSRRLRASRASKKCRDPVKQCAPVKKCRPVK